ncbi:3-hydroxyacyl-CoA dehydrogenase NAD-binding domain-containing protein, partial [Streptomyces kurssanovii]
MGFSGLGGGACLLGGAGLRRRLLLGRLRSPASAGKELGLRRWAFSDSPAAAELFAGQVLDPPAAAQAFAGCSGLRRREAHPASPAFEAPRAILDAAVEGAQVDFDTASRIESRYFSEVAIGQTAKNMIQAFFLDLQAINGGASRPEGIAKQEIKKIGVLGAGMMGAGIAYVSAKAGYDVVLKDVS